MKAACLLFLLCAALAAQSFTVPARVADRYTPVPYENQRLDGLIGERLRANLEGRLLHVDEQGLMEGFEHRPGKQAWIGEHAGKFLDAAANTWLYTHDARLKELMDRIAHRLVATQLPDGYLGTYTDDKRWTEWDVWVHKYDLLGLLAYYRVTGDKSALDAARRVGDLLDKTFGDEPGKRDIIASSTHVGMAASSVLEAMVYLYRFTGDPRHLAFCEYVIRSWSHPNGPHIIESLRDTGSVFKTANAKAYEMMSDMVGLLEMYRLTGNRVYYDTVLAAWSDISSRRLYLTGTTSSAEHFRDDYSLPGDDLADVGEGCATVTWLQINQELLRLTGEARFADQIERTVYNQLLGAQDPRNGNICYFTPMNGRKNATPGINCCVSSEPRGISLIPSVAWGEREGGAAILLYAPGSATIGDLEIRSETAFPLDGAVRLTIGKASKMPLYLRAPAWTKSFAAKAGGREYKGAPGEFVKLAGPWKAGDTVQVEMDITVRVSPGGMSYPHSVAIERGPQVLALEATLNRDVADLQIAGPATLNVSLADAAGKLPLTWLGKQAYAIDGQVAGKPRQLTLVPFADARSYRVWLERPGQ